MNKVVLDYETRSRLTIKVGPNKYARHSSTSILCLSYKIDDGKKKLWIPERAPMPADLWVAFRRAVLVAQNAGFERMITRHCLTRYPLLTVAQKEYLAAIPPSRWKCTAAKSAASSYPNALGNACIASGIETQKDKEGHRLMLKYSKPRKPTKNNPCHWFSDKWELRRIYRYSLTDVQAEYELDEKVPDLTPTEQENWVINEQINDRGILIDVETVKLILAMIKEEQGNILKKVHELSGGEIEKPTQTAKVLQWVNARGANMHNMQAATMRDMLERTDLNKEVRAMLEYRQAASKTSTAKYTRMLSVVDEDNRARGLLRYGGAQPTLRLSGQLIQPQNFPRPEPKLVKQGFTSDEAIHIIRTTGLPGLRRKYGETKVMDVIASCVRGMLIPSPGCEFFCADASQIEARLAFWFAGDDDGVEAFALGKKIYEQMAADTFGMDIKDVTKEGLERFVGKESILGCQYGMGAAKFYDQCHKKGMKNVTREIAAKAVSAYRKKYYKVPQAWKNLEEAIIAAIEDEGETYHTTRAKIWVKDGFLNIQNPSGRIMKYPRPRVKCVRNDWGSIKKEIRYWAWDWGINPETGKLNKMWKEITAWGGIFFNHLVQGFARDLMVRGIKRVEKSGYSFLLSVHDEGLAERKIGEGDLEEYIELLWGQMPKYADGAPIKAEGWKGMRYRK